MPVNFDPDSDFADALDGLETVTLRRRGSSEATVVTHALRRAATTREGAFHTRYHTRKDIPSDGRHTASEVNWHLPTKQLGDAPRLGDLIVDADGQRWTVFDVQRTTLGTRWRCVACNLAVVHSLDDTISILKASYVKGDGGAAEATWRPWQTGIRARIQPMEAQVGNEHHARQTTTRYQIFVEEDVTLDHNHCIRGPDGTIYKVLATHGAERIGQLQTVDAQVTS